MSDSYQEFYYGKINKLNTFEILEHIVNVNRPERPKFSRKE
jgi:hypothetical protein